jgi:hypothetical protein
MAVKRSWGLDGLRMTSNRKVVVFETPAPVFDCFNTDNFFSENRN